MKRIDLRKLHDAEAKEHFQVKISIFAALKNFFDNSDINRAWESIRDTRNSSRRESTLLRIKAA
jgi:hypothetical protein